MAQKAIAKALGKAASRASSNLRPALKKGQRRFGNAARIVDTNTWPGWLEATVRDAGSKIGSIPGAKPIAATEGLLGAGLLGANMLGGGSPEVEKEESPWTPLDEEADSFSGAGPMDEVLGSIGVSKKFAGPSIP